MQREYPTFHGKFKLILQATTHHWNLSFLRNTMNSSADEQVSSCYWAYDSVLREEHGKTDIKVRFSNSIKATSCHL